MENIEVKKPHFSLIKVKCDRELYLGRQADGHQLYFHPNHKRYREQIVILTKRVQFHIDNKALMIVDDPDGTEAAYIDELEKFVNFGILHVFTAEKVMKEFKDFENFIETATYKDMSRIDGTSQDYAIVLTQNARALKAKKHQKADKKYVLPEDLDLIASIKDLEIKRQTGYVTVLKVVPGEYGGVPVTQEETENIPSRITDVKKEPPSVKVTSK